MGLPAEPHLGLGRVDVHVHVAVGHIQVEDHRGVASLHQQSLVSLQHGVVQQLVPDETAVDESGHVAGVAEGLGRLAGEALTPQVLAVEGERRQVATGVAEDLPHPIPELPGGGVVRKPLAAVVEAEMHGRMGQRGAVDDVADVLDLRARRLHELEPGGNVVEQVPHLHGGPRRATRGRGTALASVLDAVPAAGFLRSRTRHHLHRGDRGDAGQGLTPETHGGDLRQIRFAADLAGGVPLEGQRHVLAGHALAVVADPDEGGAVAFHQDGDLGRASVERVVHQLLHHRRRPLHHLAGGDAVDQVVRQHRDLHGVPVPQTIPGD